jgi:protein TonB
MFEDSLVESSSLLRTRNRWPALLSFAAQMAIAAAILALPLLHPELLPLRSPTLALLAPSPRPPQPPPLPARPIRVASATVAAPAAPMEPARIQDVFTSTNSPVDSPLLAIGLNLGPAHPNLPDAMIGASPGGPHVVAVPSSGRASGVPVKVSTGVSAGLLLAPIRPDYPQIAILTRTQGSVVVQAVISISGRVESAHVLSGPVMLQAAALEAVRGARYHPYLLNNQPTEVETTFNIVFRLGP